MSALEAGRLRGRPSQNSLSHLDQPDGESFYPPFSGKLNEDKKLKLSNESFKNSIDDFFKDKDITPLSQLTATPPFPTPHVLAQFASKSYTNYKKRETDAQYETRLALPDSWKLLTTAFNGSTTNGYFGAAYWQPEHQQVVIAHRGTDLKNFGALWTDLKGVKRNNFVRQMESASTFAHKVVEVLRGVNRMKGTSFQLFFAGHSLGGWLAQITTFTTDYLKTEKNIFLKSNNDEVCFHPHTVVFDSPGCKNMLSQMTDKLDVRLDGRSIDLEHLDITSYLSAPNRINTCNKHVGTIYRIFPDLSHMGWQKKHTALYNLETHSMKKILQAFDPATGQVREDEQGRLKVQVVVDWPVSSGFKGGEEYESFFEWATHVNNYHPDIKDEIYRLGGYHPLRYQTKTYDGRVSSLGVFCQRERQFLQSYRWLRQLPKFFKPKELFDVMGNHQFQNKAEKILQNFEIENKKIRCNDASELQALIPYVKRLLQLFPRVKESTTSALSSDKIRNRLYQIETSLCVNRISQNPLDFKPEDLSLGDFLRSEQQQVLQLQMIKGDEWTGLIKVYQVLQKTRRLIEGQYTVLKLDRFLTVNNWMDMNALILSNEKQQLILMACEANQLLDDENKDIFRKLFNTIKQKKSIKFIFTISSENDTISFLQQIGRKTFGKGFVTRDEQLSWRDLTHSFQEILLKKSVKLQGATIPLSELMSAESPAANYLPLGALLEGKEIKIADPVPISDGYNKGYYVGRKFSRQIVIKQEIYRDKYDLLADSEQEFIQLCQKNSERCVHWLKRDKSGKLLWQQSQGSLETLRRYIDTESSNTYTDDDLDKLLEQAQHQKVMLISDTAGMGKSTVLTHLSNQIKEKLPTKWVVRIDLNDHTDALNTLNEVQIDKKKAIDFVLERLLNFEHGLEMELFKECCEDQQKVKTVIMLDGFDEISPSYKETVFYLLQALRQTAVEQLWVTTRPHLREELEDKLQQLSYTLQPFSGQNQIEFLTRFWSVKDWFTKMDSEEAEEAKKTMESYAKRLIKKLAQSISDKYKQFTGVPLQCRMLAEVYDEEIKTYCQSSESIAEATLRLDVHELYESFLNRKFNIWIQEKLRTPMTNVGAMETRTLMVPSIKENHRVLALNLLLTEEELTLLNINGRCKLAADVLNRIGIVQTNCEGKLHFIHRTFAEYLVADFFVNELNEGTKHSGQLESFLLQYIFLKNDYALIRIFMDVLFSKSKPSIETLKQFGWQVNQIPKDSEEIIHRAQSELNLHIIELLIISLHTGNHSETLKKLLLALDIVELFRNRAIGDGEIEALKEIWKKYKENVTRKHLFSVMLSGKCCCYPNSLHAAAQSNNTEILELVWEWAKNELTPQELKDEMLLKSCPKFMNPFHVAVACYNPKLAEKLWEWAKEELTPEELKNGLLLAKHGRRKTAFHDAAERGKPESLKLLWEYAKKELTPQEISDEFLLARDYDGKTVFYKLAEHEDVKELETFWEWAKIELPAEELRKLFLAEDNRQRTVWYLAAAQNRTYLLRKIWGWGNEILTDQDLKYGLFFAKDILEATVLHVTAEWENAESLYVIWDWAKKELSKEDLKNLLLATERNGRTAWHVAAVWRSNSFVDILRWAKEVLTPVELKSHLILAKDNFGQTALHAVVERYESHRVQEALEWARDIVGTEELKNKILLAKDNRKRTPLHMAAFNNTGSLKTVLKWAEALLNPKELKNQLLLAKDISEQTVLHVAAAVMGSPRALQEMWELAKEVLTSEELKNQLLLARDISGQTALHVAAAVMASPKALQEIWELAKEVLTSEELKNQLLLARDISGQTALHAAVNVSPEALQEIWELAKEVITFEELKNTIVVSQRYFGTGRLASISSSSSSS